MKKMQKFLALGLSVVMCMQPASAMVLAEEITADEIQVVETMEAQEEVSAEETMMEDEDIIFFDETQVAEEEILLESAEEILMPEDTIDIEQYLAELEESAEMISVQSETSGKNFVWDFNDSDNCEMSFNPSAHYLKEQWLFPGDSITIIPDPPRSDFSQPQVKYCRHVGLLMTGPGIAEPFAGGVPGYLQVTTKTYGIDSDKPVYHNSYSFITGLTNISDVPIFFSVNGSGAYASDEDTAYYAYSFGYRVANEYIPVDYYCWNEKTGEKIPDSEIYYDGTLTEKAYAKDCTPTKACLPGTGKLLEIPVPYAEGYKIRSWDPEKGKKLVGSYFFRYDYTAEDWYWELGTAYKPSRDDIALNMPTDEHLIMAGKMTTWSTLTLDANGGSIDERDKKICIAANWDNFKAFDEEFESLIPSREGYIFDGWYIDKEHTVEIKSYEELNNRFNESGDCGYQRDDKTKIARLYAKWVCEESNHKWGDWKVTEEATFHNAGSKCRVCTDCGVEQEEIIEQKIPTISLSVKTLPLQVKKSVSLKSFVKGLAEGDAIDTWKSNKTSIATVSNGKVTAKKKGTATITVTTKGGASAAFTIKVQTTKVATTSVKVPEKSITVKKGKTYKIKPTLTPITSQDTIKYSTSNKSIATVSSKGVVKGIKKGTAKITVKAGSRKAVIKVTVK